MEPRKNNYLELLVEAAIEVPTKPGCFTLDSQALRTLLYELVRQQKLVSKGSDSNLKETNEKMTQDLSSLKFLVNQIEKKMDQMSGIGDNVSRLENMLFELRENERIISESTNLLIADVEATQEHLEALQKGIVPSDRSEVVGMGELLERIEQLESSSGTRKRQPSKRTSTAAKQYQLQSSSQRKSMVKNRISLVDESRFSSKSTVLEKISEPMPTEPVAGMSQPFLELKDSIQQLGVVYTTAAEDFLTSLKADPSIQPKMLQELMIIFGGMDVNFFSMLVHSMNQHPSLTIPAFTEILDMLLTSSSNAQAMVSLYAQMSTSPPKLDIEAFSTMLHCVKDAIKVTPKGLCELLHILTGCEGLMDFLKGMTELESWSWQNMVDILEELHFSKNSTLMELVVVMQKMSESELNELMAMLLTIPGYVNELILSLPHTPSLSTQRVLEHLISLPGDAPRLLAQAVALMDKSHLQKENILRAVRRILELTARLESDSRSSDNGFYHLLKMLYKENVSLDHFGELLDLLSQSENFNMEAVRFLVQFSRDSPHDFLGALKGLLSAVAACPNLTREQISRAIRLLEKGKFVTPRNTEQLLTIMQKSGLLRQQIFDPVLEVFQKSELNNAYNLCEFYTMVKQLDFLTLEDLSHVLEQNQASSRRAYEEAMERYTMRLQEFKDVDERESSRFQEEDEVQEEEEEDPQESKEMKKKETSSDLSTVASVTPLFPKTQSHSSHEQHVSEVESAQIQEMQKEIRELYNMVNALQEEKARKGGMEQAAQEKERRKRLMLKPRKKVKKYLDEDLTVSSTQPNITVRKSSSSPAMEDGSTEMSIELEQEHKDKAIETTLDTLEDSSYHDESGMSLALQSSCMMIDPEIKEEMVKMREAMEQISEHEKECEQRYQWLSEIVSLKAESEELTRFQDAVKRQLHNFVHKIPPGPAGAKQHLPVNCLSCDSKKLLTTEPVGKSLPMTGAFPPVLSQRPHRVYEMDLIRRHARSLLEGKADRGDLYSIPRACGGEHTSVDVRQTWTYEIHQKETCARSPDGRMYNTGYQNKPKTNGTKSSSRIVYLPHPPTNL